MGRQRRREPCAALSRWQQGRRLKRAVGAVLAAALLWSALCLALWGAGVTVPFGPLPRDHGYAVQAALLPVLLPALFAVFAGVTRRRLPRLPPPAVARLGAAYAAGVTLLLVVPEAVALAVGGPAALGAVARGTLPALFFGVAAGAAWVVGPIAGGFGRGLRAVLPGLLLQAALGGLVLR